MKNNVPTTLNKEAWDNKTISRLESELQKVIILQAVTVKIFSVHLQCSCCELVTLSCLNLLHMKEKCVWLDSCFFVSCLYRKLEIHSLWHAYFFSCDRTRCHQLLEYWKSTGI